MSERHVLRFTPVINAKRRIIAKALRVASVSSAAAAALAAFATYEWSRQVELESSRPFPWLGVPGDTALAIVSICAVIVVGIVLTDQSSRYGAALSDEDRFRHQASAVISAEVLTVISLVSSFVGASAIVHGLQRTLWLAKDEPSTAVSDLLIAGAAAAISWIFVLLAAATTRTPFEIEASAALEHEAESLQILKKATWLKQWAPSQGMVPDEEMQAFIKAGRWSTRLGTLWVGTAHFLALFVACLVATTVSGEHASVLGILFLSGFLAIVPTAAYPALRRGLSNRANGRAVRGFGASLLSFVYSLLAVLLVSGLGSNYAAATALAVCTVFLIASTVTRTLWRRFSTSNTTLKPFPAIREHNWQPLRAIPIGLLVASGRQHLREVRVRGTRTEVTEEKAETAAILRHLRVSAGASVS
ncbi:MAG: hypothetical protein JWR57_1012 [Mycetocola sp.]|nr:hypothetical protein [Mycetocola sp.]